MISLDFQPLQTFFMGSFLLWGGKNVETGCARSDMKEQAPNSMSLR